MRATRPVSCPYMEAVSSRLVLRPFAATDVDDVHLWASDPAVCFFTDWGPNSQAETEAFVADAVHSGSPDNAAITLANEILGASGPVAAGTVVGNISAFGAHGNPTEVNPDARELGWVVRRDLWGLGLATEAVTAFVRSLADAGVNEFYARCRPQNRASSRVMEHVGFEYVRTVSRDKFVRGAWADSDIYQLVIHR